MKLNDAAPGSRTISGWPPSMLIDTTAGSPLELPEIVQVTVLPLMLAVGWFRLAGPSGP